ncbi:MAG TPA: hypothetical protein VMZ51_01965 [Acidimicrobiales bacterium]|nr:hypothetical protein [Acidimicrobiales bacterium]
MATDVLLRRLAMIPGVVACTVGDDTVGLRVHPDADPRLLKARAQVACAEMGETRPLVVVGGCHGGAAGGVMDASAGAALTSTRWASSLSVALTSLFVLSAVIIAPWGSDGTGPLARRPPPARVALAPPAELTPQVTGAPAGSTFIEPGAGLVLPLARRGLRATSAAASTGRVRTARFAFDGTQTVVRAPQGGTAAPAPATSSVAAGAAAAPAPPASGSAAPGPSATGTEPAAAPGASTGTERAAAAPPAVTPRTYSLQPASSSSTRSGKSTGHLSPQKDPPGNATRASQPAASPDPGPGRRSEDRPSGAPVPAEKQGAKSEEPAPADRGQGHDGPGRSARGEGGRGS